MTIKQLKEKRLSLIEQQKDLHKRVSGENREMTADESQQWDRIEADLKGIRDNIEREETLRRNLAEVEDTVERHADETGTKPNLDYAKTFFRAMRFGMNALSTDERQLMQQNFHQEKRGTNPQAAGTDNLGGYLVPEGFGDELITTMALWGGMLDVCRLIRTASGNALPYPTLNDTATSGTLLAENAANAVSDVTLGVKTLNAYKYTGGIVKMSLELLQDEAIRLEDELGPIFARRMGVKFNTDLTSGDGSSKPTGILTSATSGKTSAAVAAVTRGELVDLMHSVDPAYRPNSRWMFNDATLAAIKKLSFGSSDDRPLWQASVREGAPDTLEGRPYTINQQMPDLGATNTPILFGDFGMFYIRIVRDMTMFQFREKYMDAFQIGYTAFMRGDGLLMDTAAVKKLTNAAS